ncbi:hypothetical protein BDN70DRAFT_901524 [Pholiota conissans]|uniref:Uncharacterized protein n=1 Tax=Pholiota conissans TaxID=109636 RepID=A0A9P6CLI9_9AGAR|nr:hypothetical protein BDN70DRAFT_901524 [Pholiota conissans]
MAQGNKVLGMEKQMRACEKKMKAAPRSGREVIKALVKETIAMTPQRFYFLGPEIGRVADVSSIYLHCEGIGSRESAHDDASRRPQLFIPANIESTENRRAAKLDDARRFMHGVAESRDDRGRTAVYDCCIEMCCAFSMQMFPSRSRVCFDDGEEGEHKRHRMSLRAPNCIPRHEVFARFFMVSDACSRPASDCDSWSLWARQVGAEKMKMLVTAVQKGIYQLQSALPLNGACFITAAVHGRDSRLTVRVFEAANVGGCYAGGMHLYLDETPATFNKALPNLQKGDQAFSKRYRNWHKRDIWEMLERCDILYIPPAQVAHPLGHMLRPIDAEGISRR